MRVAVTLLAGALLVSGCSGDSGDDGRAERSQAYTAAVEQWRTDVLVPVGERVDDARFSELVVIDRRETTAERRAQALRCDEVAATATAVAELTSPTLEGDGTSEVEALSSALTAGTAAYRDAVLAPLSEVADYCTAYGRTIDLSNRREAAERALTRTLSKPGVLSRTTRREGLRIITTTITCDAPKGCIPGRERLPAYLKAYKKVRIDLQREEVRLRSGRSAPCPLTDFATLCGVYGTAGPPVVTAAQRVYDTVRSARSTTDNPSIDRANAVADAATTRLRTRYRAAFRALFPTVALSGDYTTRTGKALVARYEARARAVPLPSTTPPPPATTPPG